MQLQAELSGVNFSGSPLAGDGAVFQADGPGNGAWQRSMVANARLNAKARRN